ncbi:MAG: glycoside hydrolase family 57 protein [Brevinematia bacterium]
MSKLKGRKMFNFANKGFWLLVLHAHLPFVRHPEYNDSLEERWLYEAVIETYVPLLDMFERLLAENIEFKLVLSITPTLCNMLDDTFLQNRIVNHLEKLIELAEKEIERNRYDEDFFQLAKMYYQRFNFVLYLFKEKYKKNILSGFKKFQDLGFLEIVTSSATHCYLPLYEVVPVGVRAQIKIGIEEYKKYFGRYPTGIWNAECGYYNGLDRILFEENIGFFFTDTHTVLNASEKPKYGVFAPLSTSNGVVFFGRDVETSRLVWSSKEGYPGDPYYREFYRDIGYDLDFNYVKPYILETGERIFTGIKYYRITDKNGPLEHKRVYEIEKAKEKVRQHSLHFVNSRDRQINYLSDFMDRKPLIVSMYDAELFGHWWFEGIDFLYNVIKLINESSIIKMILPSEYLELYRENQVAEPSMSSWGSNGYSEFWLNETNDWIYRHLHKATERMIELATIFYKAKSKVYVDCLNQAARELLIAQSSDWPFIMKTMTMVDYAKNRIVESLNNFNTLYKMLKNKDVDEKFVKRLNSRNNIFQDIDYRVFARV